MHGKFSSFHYGLSALALHLLTSTSAYALPQDGKVTAGSATITQTGKNLDIRQQSSRAVIDWRKFDIEVDEHTQFHQPNSGSTILNRVNDVNPSRIMGKMSANGNVVLINPNGVFFGQGSKVDVNGLIATTADIKNADFMTGKGNFTRTGNPNAKIVNQGIITAKQAGLVGLVAPQVENSGIISAEMGTVQLSSGDQVTVDLRGDGLMKIAVSDDVKSQLVTNSGKINAQGGKIALTAAAGRHIVDSLITVSGELKAPTVKNKSGKIIIAAEGSNAIKGNQAAAKGKKTGESSVLVDGKLDVSGKEKGQKGGVVEMAADNLILKNRAKLDASGNAGGGEVHIGGDYQGKGSRMAARHVFVEKEASVNVDAQERGHGGTAIFWADRNNYFYGNVSARGGSKAGNGGFVEVSGKEYLKYKGDVNTLATYGLAGTLLLDPTDIVILSGSGDGDDADASSASFAGNPSGTVGVVLSGDTGPTTLYESELEGLSTGSNIQLTSSNSITINDLADNTLSLNRGIIFTTGAGGFSMNAGDTISTSGIITFNVTGGTTQIGSLAGSGAKTITTDNAATVNGIISGSGTLTKTGTGSLTLKSANTYTGATNISGAGSFILDSNGSFGSNTVTFTNGNLQTIGAHTIANNLLYLTNSSITGDAATVFNGTISGNGNFILTINNSGLTTFAGPVNIVNSGSTSRTLTINNISDVVISGVVANGGTATASALTKSGTGKLSLTNTNTFGGTFTMNAGQIALSSASSIGTGTISMAGGSWVNDGSRLTIANALSLNGNTTEFTGTGGFDFNGATNVATTTTLNFNNAAKTNFGGAVTLGGNLTLAGNSDVEFSNTVTLTGSRTLAVNNTGSNVFNGAISLSNVASNRVLTVNGTGNVELNGVISNGSSTASGFSKSGTGTVTLGNANTYTGANTISGGKIILESATALGTASLTSTGGEIEANSPFTIANNLTFSSGMTTFSGTGAITFSGTAGFSTVSIRQNNSGGLSFTGNATLNGNPTVDGSGNISFSAITQTGSRVLTFNNAGTATLGGTFNLSNSATNYNVQLGGSADVMVNGVLSNNSSSASTLTKIGTGTLTLNGNNTYTGATTINAGTLTLGAANRLSNSTSVTVASGATFNMNGYSETISSISNSGTLAMGTGNTLTTSGAQTHSGKVTGGTVSLISTGGAITANNTLNDFTGTLTASALTTVSLVDANALTLGSVSGSVLTLRALAGNLTLTGGVSATATSGNSILMTTTNQFINSVGAGVLTMAGTGYFTIYSNSSADDTRGGLGGFNRYGCTYAGSPSCAVGTNIPVNSSGFYFAFAPTLSITGLSALDKTYNGTTAATLSGTAALSGILNGDTVGLNTASMTGAFNNKSAGAGKTVNVTGYTLSGTNLGYLLTGVTSLTATINKANLLVSGLTASNKVYDGTTTAVLGGTATVSPLGGDVVSAIGTAIGTLSAAQVGTRNVTVTGLSLTGTDAANYNIIQQTGLTANITPRAVTVATITANNKVYNGSAAATLTGYTFDDAIGGDDIAVSGLTGSFANANAGNGKTVTLTGGSFGGTDAANYTFTLGSATTTANITPRAVTVASITAGNKVYNGSAAATLTGYTFDDAIGGDDIAVSGLTGAFNNANAGNGKTVTLTGGSFGGTDAANYTFTLGSATTTANITPRAVTVASITANNKVYNGSAAATLTGYTFDDAIGGDNIAVSGLTGAFNNANAGNGKTVTLTGGSFGGTDAANYTFTLGSATTTANITPRAVTVASITAGSKVYNGSAAATLTGYTFDDAIGGDDIAISGLTGSFANANAGNGKTVTLTGGSFGGTDAANYTFTLGSATTTANITPRAVTVATITAGSKVYNGSAAATLTGYTFDDAISGDDIAVSGLIGSFANANAGNGKTVTLTGGSFGGTDAANYTFTLGSATTTANITPRAVTVATITANNKVYDGTTAATLSAYTFDNQVAGDNLSLSNIVATFDTAAIGNNKTVIITGGTLSGSKAGNYTFTLGSASDLANITELTIDPEPQPNPAVSYNDLPDTVQSASTMQNPGMEFDEMVEPQPQLVQANTITDAEEEELRQEDPEDNPDSLQVQRGLTLMNGLITVSPKLSALLNIFNTKG